MHSRKLRECLRLGAFNALLTEQCDAIHRTIKDDFKHAIVYGRSVKHQPQRVGLSHELADEDIGRFKGKQKREIWISKLTSHSLDRQAVEDLIQVLDPHSPERADPSVRVCANMSLRLDLTGKVSGTCVRRHHTRAWMDRLVHGIIIRGEVLYLLRSACTALLLVVDPLKV